MMGDIKDMYGSRGPDFIRGFLAAIDCYAVWNSGKQWIGSPEKEAKGEMVKAILDLGGNLQDYLKEVEPW